MTVTFVVDTVAPVITIPVDVTVEATGANTVVDIGVATAVDNVINNATVTQSNDAPASYPIGTTVVTYSASDDAGNSATATQNVTIIDTCPRFPDNNKDDAW